MNVFVRIRYSHALRFVPGAVLVERGERLDERLLDQVLGVGRVAGHAQGGRIELVDERQRVGLEPRGALLDGLLGRCPVLRHRLRAYWQPRRPRRAAVEGRGGVQGTADGGCDAA